LFDEVRKREQRQKQATSGADDVEEWTHVEENQLQACSELIMQLVPLCVQYMDDAHRDILVHYLLGLAFRGCQSPAGSAAAPAVAATSPRDLYFVLAAHLYCQSPSPSISSLLQSQCDS